jgi:glucan phosphoethanolaminetransferase (alkaline phosphatase superfamily)
MSQCIIQTDTLIISVVSVFTTQFLQFSLVHSFINKINEYVRVCVCVCVCVYKCVLVEERMRVCAFVLVMVFVCVYVSLKI